jgi:hypothetical protein
MCPVRNRIVNVLSSEKRDARFSELLMSGCPFRPAALQAACLRKAWAGIHDCMGMPKCLSLHETASTYDFVLSLSRVQRRSE